MLSNITSAKISCRTFSSMQKKLGPTNMAERFRDNRQQVINHIKEMESLKALHVKKCKLRSNIQMDEYSELTIASNKETGLIMSLKLFSCSLISKSCMLRLLGRGRGGSVITPERSFWEAHNESWGYHNAFHPFLTSPAGGKKSTGIYPGSRGAPYSAQGAHKVTRVVPR